MPNLKDLEAFVNLISKAIPSLDQDDLNLIVRNLPIDTIEKVEEFHSVTQPQTITDKPNKAFNKDRAILRLSLILEELSELAESYGESTYTLYERLLDARLHKRPQFINVGMKHSLDALCDLRYVCDGTILEQGFAEIFDEAFQNVHESNMSKLCKTEEELDQTVNRYAQEGIKTINTRVGNYFVVQRPDGKTLKSIKYQPADVEQFLKERRDE